ncbi:hypothetical protein Aduo_016721 [Ancylostoma duodenale]
MFVIVNRTEQKAIAYVSTLGRIFGSKIKSSRAFFLNNLLSEMNDVKGRNDPFVRLLPTILYTSKGEISLALATNGGSTRHSLSLPRTISMLFLKKDFNVSISESSMYPLAFPLAENFKPRNSILMKDRVPYVERLHRKYHVTDIKPDLPDEVVVIESANNLLSAMHANNHHETYHMPAGI